MGGKEGLMLLILGIAVFAVVLILLLLLSAYCELTKYHTSRHNNKTEENIVSIISFVMGVPILIIMGISTIIFEMIRAFFGGLWSIIWGSIQKSQNVVQALWNALTDKHHIAQSTANILARCYPPSVPDEECMYLTFVAVCNAAIEKGRFLPAYLFETISWFWDILYEWVHYGAEQAKQIIS
ncbi:MAG: hypothetical protein AAF639_37000 [Chloroflexota bacterium]